MPPAQSNPLRPVVLVLGEDDFAAKQRARQIYQQWCAECGGLDHEIIDGSAAHSGEALAALARLREALQTLPFFGKGKVVWLRNCTFLGDERAATAQAVTESLQELAQELKQFDWSNVRLLINAVKIDKRRTFFKTIENLGAVEVFAGWSLEDRDWTSKAENAARRQLKSLGKVITSEALARLVAYTGPDPRLLNSETEKTALYAGEREEITLEDVDTIATRNKQSRAFALGDALGNRDLRGLLRTLDDELWEMKRDSQKSEIGLLYMLISKVRVMIFLK
jgi:DNA polymerase-3 subunit delta